MVVLIVVTAVFQSMINNIFGSLLRSLPLSLVDRIEVRPMPISQQGGNG